MINFYIRRLVERSRDVFWIRDVQYIKQLYVSPAYETVWGRSCESLYQRPEKWLDFLLEEDRKRLEISVAKRNPEVNPQQGFDEWYRIKRPDGEIRWIQDQSFPIYDEQNQHIGFAGIAQDITEQKILEKKLIDSQAKEARFKAMSTLGGMIAHELRTPLVTIEGSMYNIERVLPTLIAGYEVGVKSGQIQEPIRKDLLEALKQTLDDTKHSVNYAQATIDTILTGFYHSSEAKLSQRESFSIRQAVQQAIQNYPFGKTEKDLVVIKHLDDTTIDGEQAIIVHVLHNLIKNALHVIEAAGKGKITIWTEQQLRHMTLNVEDTAMGIESECLNHIFDAFYTTKKKTAASIGLGLYFCKMALEKVNGKITCESEFGQYARFIITLPLPPTMKLSS